MRKVKICKKLSKLIHIECSDMDCKCLESKEFVAVNDLYEVLSKFNPETPLKVILSELHDKGLTNSSSTERLKEGENETINKR